MGHSRESLIRRMQDVLRGEAVGDAERVRIVGELHARVRRLQSANRACSQVRVSQAVQAMLPTVLSA